MFCVLNTALSSVCELTFSLASCMGGEAQQNSGGLADLGLETCVLVMVSMHSAFCRLEEELQGEGVQCGVSPFLHKELESQTGRTGSRLGCGW
jgi:hypothetical protein